MSIDVLHSWVPGVTHFVPHFIPHFVSHIVPHVVLHFVPHFVPDFFFSRTIPLVMTIGKRRIPGWALWLWIPNKTSHCESIEICQASNLTIHLASSFHLVDRVCRSSEGLCLPSGKVQYRQKGITRWSELFGNVNDVDDHRYKRLQTIGQNCVCRVDDEWKTNCSWVVCA